MSLIGTISKDNTSGLTGQMTTKQTLQGRLTSKQRLTGGLSIGTVFYTSTAPRIGYVTLLASAWVGEENLYSQVVDIEGVTENSQVDLTPDVGQLAVFYNKDLAFVTENEDGVVTVYAIGQKPQDDYTIQVTITEVDV